MGRGSLRSRIVESQAGRAAGDAVARTGRTVRAALPISLGRHGRSDRARSARPLHDVAPQLPVTDLRGLRQPAERREHWSPRLDDRRPASIWTLNNRRVFRQAELLAARLTREAGEDPAAQIDRVWQIAVGRRPTETERTESRALLDTLASESSRPAALPTFCLAMFNLNEFLFVE